jgi:hypothetical protein
MGAAQGAYWALRVTGKFQKLWCRVTAVISYRRVERPDPIDCGLPALCYRPSYIRKLLVLLRKTLADSSKDLAYACRSPAEEAYSP